jgi:hypothetical protein
MNAAKAHDSPVYRPQWWLPLCTIIIYTGTVVGNIHDAQTATSISGQSDLDEARSAAQEKYNARPSDPEIQMSFAGLLKNGDSARSIYKKVIGNEKNPDSLKAEAYFRLACISYLAANYEKAGMYCASACSLDKKETYLRLCGRAAMLAGRDSANQSLKTLKTDSLQAGADPSKKTGQSAEKKPAVAAYYLQVAAFSELENAQGLKKDLARLFPKVAVKEGSSRGKNIFRVRIGPFSSNKEAQAYGDSALVKNKISFRIVED